MQHGQNKYLKFLLQKVVADAVLNRMRSIFSGDNYTVLFLKPLKMKPNPMITAFKQGDIIFEDDIHHELTTEIAMSVKRVAIVVGLIIIGTTVHHFIKSKK